MTKEFDNLNTMQRLYYLKHYTELLHRKMNKSEDELREQLMKISAELEDIRLDLKKHINTIDAHKP